METEFLIFGKEIQNNTRELSSVMSVSRVSGKFSFSKKCLEEMGNPSRIFFLKKGNVWFVMPSEEENALRIGGKEGSARKGFTAISFVDKILPKEHEKILVLEYPIVKTTETYQSKDLFKILFGHYREIGKKRVK